MKYLKDLKACLKSLQQLIRLPLTFTNGGFTLLEILVVVLIIGILGAIALPQYQRAVLKSRFSGMMPIAKALAEANEVYYLEHGEYSENPADLLVAGRDKNAGAYPDGTSVLMYSDEADLSFVRTENASIPNARYVVYQKHSTNFPDTTWCEASDEQAEAMCEALGGVLPEGLEGNSGADGNWTAYLLGGQARPGDTFAGGGESGDNNGGNSNPQTPTCSGEKPADIGPTETNSATGTATCVNGQWKYQWTGGNVYATDYSSYTAVCTGDSAYKCAGSEFKGSWNGCMATQENGCADSTFSGEQSRCYGNAANGCADSTFSGRYSYCHGQSANVCAGSTFSGQNSSCGGLVANGCAGSTFSGLYSRCYGDAANSCAGSTFSGEKSDCVGNVANGCAGATIQAGSFCNAGTSGGCDGAKYGADPTGTRSGMGGCYENGGACPTGVPLRGNWNSSNGSYDYTWKGNCCNPAYMVSGECPSGVTVCAN